VWILAEPAQADTATAGAVLQTPERYDRQSVTLAGTVSNLDQRVSQRGNAYYTFDLQDATGRIRVFSFGKVPCPEGKQAIVDGTFEAVKRMGRYTFYNEVTASHVTCR
jgi:DNA polymerase III alpha subunit